MLFVGTSSALAWHHWCAVPLLCPRLLGVDRVVVYNNTCGQELDRLLRVYSEEGFVEMVPWPIHEHLVPSHGWKHSVSGGDVHYFGQQVTLNECIYRSMAHSRYVLLNDIDEIIMPYQHDDLTSLMNVLQEQHPNVGYFSALLQGSATVAMGISKKNLHFMFKITNSEHEITYLSCRFNKICFEWFATHCVFHFQLIIISDNCYSTAIYIIYVRYSILSLTSPGSLTPGTPVSVFIGLILTSLNVSSFCHRSECSWLRTIYSQRIILSPARSSTCLNGITCLELISWSTSTRRHRTDIYTIHTRWFCGRSR